METISCEANHLDGDESKPYEPPSQPTPAGRPRVRRTPSWLFPALTLTLVFLGQEGLFRALFPIAEVKNFNRISYQMMARDHPRMRAMMERGLVYDHLLLESEPDGFSEIHTLNGYGFRGADFAISPSPGRRRILIVGDSVAEGLGASDSATIDRELERLLKADGEHVEVINLGVIAATLAHETILTRDAVTLLHPADVVVVLYCNDLPAPPYEPAFDQPAPSFPRLDQSWWMPRVAAMLDRYIHDQPICRRWPQTPIRFFAAAPSVTNPLRVSDEPPKGLDPALYEAMIAGKLNPFLSAQSTDMPRLLTDDFTSSGSPAQHLKRMQSACEAVGSRLTIAYVPFCAVVSKRYVDSLVRMGMDRTTAEAMSVDPIYARQNRAVAEVCRTLKLPLADTTEDLARADASGTPQYWSFDTHPRPAGYATIARCLHRALRRESE